MALIQQAMEIPLVANQLQFGLGHTLLVDHGLNVNMADEPGVDRDGGMWFFNAVPAYVKETGDLDFYRKTLPYADAGEASVLGHLRKAIEFNLERSGAHGLPCGLHADWNDCIRLGEKGETVFVAMQLRYGLRSLTVDGEARRGRPHPRRPRPARRSASSPGSDHRFRRPTGNGLAGGTGRFAGAGALPAVESLPGGARRGSCFPRGGRASMPPCASFRSSSRLFPFFPARFHPAGSLCRGFPASRWTR